MDDNSTNKRRKWTPAEKMRIVVTGMQPGVEISDLCRQEGIHATQYYTWKKQLLGSAERVFERQRRLAEAREARKCCRRGNGGHESRTPDNRSSFLDMVSAV